MREIWVADSETDPFKAGRVPYPFIWGCYNGSEYHEFDTTKDFLDFITKRECVVYAHNGGKFDWHYCLDRLEAFSPLMVIAGRLAKFQIGEAEFRDSYNILPMPLSAYQKDEMDYAIMEPGERDKPHNRKKIRDYLRNDCVYLYDLVTQFIDRYGSNLTVAGTAMKVWQKIAKTKAPETSAFFYESMSPYYYGGRVECFKSGIIERPFKVIDINSAYPFAMMHRHPIGDNYTVSDSLPNSRAYTERSFIRVMARSDGAFPYRTQAGLSFPSDNVVREYFVTGWEWLAALDTGTVHDWDIISVITFPDSIEFTDYIDHFYEQKTTAKATGDKAGYLFAKLFLNSLYGKFAANPDKYNEYTVVRPHYIEAAESDDYSFCAELGGWALMGKPISEEKQRFYNVATAASITGFVRAYLWRAVNQCQGVMYCDTDSIACESTGSLALDADKLGDWDIEAECDLAAIAGKKLYAFRKTPQTYAAEKAKDATAKLWKTASKGVRLDADEIVRIANGETVTYASESPSYSLKRGIKFISRNISKIS